ncbi:hypothetical protein E2P81_ATG03013 [Venturia nashicola]|uniref:Uncharacterized protein n=1 Tax=Venturia nashicola TaxID=86259 RepID=A0A4Z1PE68_9PEZI|nr:hypothetical protein E6O75_ATG03077 [Venturia nashicola]TLD36124.1 hypothetical protein E2P81_ATG03013 [Venturia nashicola]
MPLSNASNCCHCLAGPWLHQLYASCIECQHEFCSRCDFVYIQPTQGPTSQHSTRTCLRNRLHSTTATLTGKGRARRRNVCTTSAKSLLLAGSSSESSGQSGLSPGWLGPYTPASTISPATIGSLPVPSDGVEQFWKRTTLFVETTRFATQHSFVPSSWNVPEAVLVDKKPPQISWAQPCSPGGVKRISRFRASLPWQGCHLLRLRIHPVFVLSLSNTYASMPHGLSTSTFGQQRCLPNCKLWYTETLHQPRIQSYMPGKILKLTLRALLRHWEADFFAGGLSSGQRITFPINTGLRPPLSLRLGSGAGSLSTFGVLLSNSSSTTHLIVSPLDPHPCILRFSSYFDLDLLDSLSGNFFDINNTTNMPQIDLKQSIIANSVTSPKTSYPSHIMSILGRECGSGPQLQHFEIASLDVVTYRGSSLEPIDGIVLVNCCSCGSGPRVAEIAPACTECGHQRCDGCTTIEV